MKNNEKGTSLIEAMMSLLILSIVVAGLMPSLVAHSDVNLNNERRTGAMEAASIVMEGLRLDNPTLLPTTGTQTDTVTVGDRDYAAVTTFCADPSLCTASSRHLVVEVSHDGQKLYTTETVYTELR